MHFQVIRNDHAPYRAMVKIRDTMDANPRETWYIQEGPDGFYAQAGHEAGLVTAAESTIEKAIYSVIRPELEDMFPRGGIE